MAREFDSVEAVDLLKDDHHNVERLFRRFEDAESPAEKQAIARDICLELTIHTRIEEEIFYPACEGKIDEDLLHEAYVEHDGAKVLVAELSNSGPEDEFFDAKMKVLSEQIEHHVKEEEKLFKGLFHQAEAAGLDMRALGARLAARKKGLAAEYEATGLPNPETRSYSGHELMQGKPVHGITLPPGLGT